MSLIETQRSFKESASALGDYMHISKTELANGYCDADEEGDEVKKNQYFAAFMLRYWNSIYKWKANSLSLNMQTEDFLEWLEEAFSIAFRYRKWRYEFEPILKKSETGKDRLEFAGWKLDANGNKIPNKVYYKVDPNAPDKIMNRCIFSVRGMFYQYTNKDKRKCNTQTYSIEGGVDENGDYALDYMGCAVAPKLLDGTYELVKNFLSKDKTIEALVIDGIVNSDTFKANKTISHYDDKDSQGRDIRRKIINKTEVFDPRKLVKHLSTIDEKYIKEIFCPHYELNHNKGKQVYEEVKKLSNQKLYKYINKTLIEIRENKKLLDYLID